MRTRDPNRHYLRGGKIYGRGFLPHSAMPGGEGGASPGEGLPGVRSLAAHISGMDASEVAALRARDGRKSAAPIYEARLRELEG